MCAATLVQVYSLHTECGASLLNDLLVAKLFSDALNFISLFFFLSRADNIEKYLFTLFVSKNTFLCFINLKEKQNCVSVLNWCGNVCKQ